jgi:DNA-binding HxlR family transcriptional regulator
MTLKNQILEALKDGPGLACELSVEIGIDSRRLSANLVDLERRGFITKRPFWKSEPLLSRPRVWLYALKEAA